MDLAGVFQTAVARNGKALAFVDGPLRRSYVEWSDDIARLAAGLAAMGLRRGDRLVCIMPNCYAMATLYWGCHALGAIFTPFNWRATPDEVAYAVGDAAPRLVAFDAKAAEGASAGVAAAGIGDDALVTIGGDGTGTPFLALVQSDPLERFEQLDDTDICTMLYTSGTTGRPKGVPRSVGAERIAATSVIAHHGYRFGERALGVMPLFHTMGIRTLLCMTMVGGAYVNMSGFDAGRALSLIESERISALFLVPTMFHDMLGHEEFASRDLTSVSKLAYAGMAMTGDLERRCARAFNPTFFGNYYGSSEIFTFTFCDHLDRKPGCAGYAGINQIVRVVRADVEGGASPDEVLPPNEVGEVIGSMRNPEAFTGYWNRPDADAKVIRDGWYFTGDLGYVDEDGALFLCGRIDDMIISGGENIHPEEVEDALADSPLVDAAAVVGFPDDRWGHKVVAFIEPASTEANADALDAHCLTSSLARFKRPRAYAFIERIPRSASGKLLRRLLREGDYVLLDDFESTL